ncbi:MAG: hypothetical protein ACRD0U_05620 [Acidimicrobiales bacterium]
MQSTTFRFAEAVRTVADQCRRNGYAVPGFRSPPRLRDVDRSLRRRPDGGATVAVVLRDRPWAAVLADMVDGVVAANRLDGAAADRCRSALWDALGGEALAAA